MIHGKPDGLMRIGVGGRDGCEVTGYPILVQEKHALENEITVRAMKQYITGTS